MISVILNVYKRPKKVTISKMLVTMSQICDGKIKYK